MDNKRFFIAGVQHHKLSEVIDSLDEGAVLDLVPEPTNKFDPNAIRIEFDGVMCGYVPKKFSAEVSAALSIGAELECTIISLNPSAKPWEQCEVTVEEVVSSEDVADEDEDEDRCPECDHLLDDCVCIEEE